MSRREIDQMDQMFYLVRAENGGEPESYVFGLYDKEHKAQDRVTDLEDEGFEYAWYDEVQVGDLDLCNRWIMKTIRIQVETYDGCRTIWYEKSKLKNPTEVISKRVNEQLCGLNIKRIEVSLSPATVWQLTRWPRPLDFCPHPCHTT